MYNTSIQEDISNFCTGSLKCLINQLECKARVQCENHIRKVLIYQDRTNQINNFEKL